MRANALEVEKRWRKTLGESRFDELRETLVPSLSVEAGESQTSHRLRVPQCVRAQLMLRDMDG
jgi:hypothetical protein